MTTAAYLGDAVYARLSGDDYIALYTSNGITESEPIYLEDTVLVKLIQFAVDSNFMTTDYIKRKLQRM